MEFKVLGTASLVTKYSLASAPQIIPLKLKRLSIYAFQTEQEDLVNNLYTVNLVCKEITKLKL